MVAPTEHKHGIPLWFCLLTNPVKCIHTRPLILQQCCQTERMQYWAISEKNKNKSEKKYVAGAGECRQNVSHSQDSV